MEQKKNDRAPVSLRLADLRRWHSVIAACPACNRRARLDAAMLGRGRPPMSRLVDLERHLVCGSCGNRPGNRLLVTMASRD
jgi:hypothetical protein